MQWRGRRGSDNIEDRRGMGGGLPGGFRRGGMGRGGIVGGGIGGIALLLVALFFGVDPSVILGGGGYDDGRGGYGGGYESGPSGGYGGQGGAPAVQPPGRQASNDELTQFVSVVLAETEDTWNRVFRDQLGRDYQEPQLVLFSGGVQSGCGAAEAAMGPFYCPLDGKVYIDLAFYRELRDRFQAPGDFAQAYVLAHEVGHHVQNLLGISDEVQAARRRVSREEGNRLSVMLELQADCLAGLWANSARERRLLEPGDVEEAINAAAAVGDDRIQRQSRGSVNPESFTHGSSEQRARWFYRGYETGQLQACDTFSGNAVAER